MNDLEKKQILEDVNKIIDCKMEIFAANMYCESIKSTMEYVENKEELKQELQKTKQHIIEVGNKIIRIMNNENES